MSATRSEVLERLAVADDELSRTLLELSNAGKDITNLTGDDERRVHAIEMKLQAARSQLRADFGETLEESATHRPVRQINPSAGDTEDAATVSARRVDLLRRGDSMLDYEVRHGARSAFSKTDAEEFSLGRLVRGMLLGDWHDAALERRALSEGTNSAGGFLTPEMLSARIIDRIRKKARVLEAGAQTLRLGSDSVSLPRLATGVTGAWRAENAAVTESDPTFERITFTPKSLAVMVKLSYELYEDMVDGSGELIDAELINALTLEIDRVALRGSGTGQEPAGLKNITGVDEIGTVGSPTYADLMTAVGAILADNLEPTAAIMSSRDYMTLGALADTTGQPLRPPKPVEDLRLLVTNQVPTNLGAGTNESEIFVGDFTQLIIGVKPYVRVEVQKHGGPFDVALKRTDQRYIENMQIAILAAVRADVQVLHPEAFQILTGTTA